VPIVWGVELPAKLLFNLTATAVAVAIAFVSWHLFEKQVLKLKRFVPYGKGPAAAMPQPARLQPAVQQSGARAFEHEA